jgi:hypothetical protein
MRIEIEKNKVLVLPGLGAIKVLAKPNAPKIISTGEEFYVPPTYHLSFKMYLTLVEKLRGDEGQDAKILLALERAKKGEKKVKKDTKKSTEKDYKAEYYKDKKHNRLPSLEDILGEDE